MGTQFILSATQELKKQYDEAKRMADVATWKISSNDRLYLTGHSLGGGLAQLVAADLGLSAFAISSPIVSEMYNCSFNAERSGADIVCLKIQPDPINRTDVTGGRLLGRTITLNTNRSGYRAHSITKTVLELSPSGSGVGSLTGQITPF